MTSDRHCRVASQTDVIDGVAPLPGGRTPSQWRRLVGVVAVGLAAIAWLLSACGTSPLLPAVLGPALVAKPVVHGLRRPEYQPFHEKLMEYLLVAPTKADWPSKLELLPKEAAGGTDWVKALNENLITPKPGLDAKAEDEPVMDMDVELVPKDLPDFKATYPHKLHTQLLACTNCHPAIFKMEKGGDPITMEKIFAGEYCGRCHGRVAFDPVTACPRCHLSMPQ